MDRGHYASSRTKVRAHWPMVRCLSRAGSIGLCNSRRARVASVSVLLALCACRKEERHTPSTGSAGSAQLALAPQDAALAVAPDAAGAGASIDLFRAVPSTIRVSSKVKNKAIKPEHI